MIIEDVTQEELRDLISNSERPWQFKTTYCFNWSPSFPDGELISDRNNSPEFRKRQMDVCAHEGWLVRFTPPQ